MEAGKGSNALVAVVSFYADAMVEKEREIAGLKIEASHTDSIFAQLGHFLEGQVEGLKVQSPVQAVSIVMDTIRTAKVNAQLLFEQAAQTSKAAAALREALRAVGVTRTGVEPPTERTTLQELVARVGAALVDLRAAEARDRGPRGMARELVVQWARAWAEAPRAKGNVEGLIKAVQKLDQRDGNDAAAREWLKREDAVLTAARAYGRLSPTPNETEAYAYERAALGLAACELAALDVKPT